MQKYINNIVTSNLAPVAGASVTVNVLGGSAATIYSDNGVTTTANPLVTDSNGNFSFYAADGRYSLSISGTGILPYTVNDILLEDPADNAQVIVPWTPTDASGAGLVFTQAAGTCIKTGKQVFISARVTYPVTADLSAAIILAPFVSGVAGQPQYNSTNACVTGGTAQKIVIDRGTAFIYLYAAGNTMATNAGQSGQLIDFSLVYQTP